MVLPSPHPLKHGGNGRPVAAVDLGPGHPVDESQTCPVELLKQRLKPRRRIHGVIVSPQWRFRQTLSRPPRARDGRVWRQCRLKPKEPPGCPRPPVPGSAPGRRPFVGVGSMGLPGRGLEGASQLVEAVLGALSAPREKDIKTLPQRYHDALREAMRRLVATDVLPARAG